MVRTWLNRINSIVNYNDLIKFGYELCSIEDKEIIELWNKVIDACIEIDESKFIYSGKTMGLLESHNIAFKFFEELYGSKVIHDEIDGFLDRTLYRKGNDYMYYNAQTTRQFDVGSKKIYSFLIEMYDDILTTDLIIHEFGHALYPAPIEYLYDEVIAMTFERIFSSNNHNDLDTLNTLSAFKSAYYEGPLDVKPNTLRGKIKFIEKLYGKTYLIGDITSLYLLEKYKDDPNTFRQLINMCRSHNNAPKEILKYYGFDFKSSEVDNLLDKDIEKVKKRMYN